MMVAIHSFEHDGESFLRGKTRVRDDHPAVAAHPGCFAPAPDIAKRSERRDRPADTSASDLEEELSYRRERIAAHRVRAREDERAREREERQKARKDEAAFWDSTAVLLSGDTGLRAELDELNAIEQGEAEEEDWATWRRAQMDPSSQDWWDQGIEMGERLRLDPDGSVAEAVREENQRIRRSKEIADGEVELWGDGGE